MKNKHLPLFKHGNDPDKLFDKKELKKGIKIEMEHTNSKKIAKQITKAHLSEDPHYNTHLEKFERMFKRK